MPSCSLSMGVCHGCSWWHCGTYSRMGPSETGGLIPLASAGAAGETEGEIQPSLGFLRKKPSNTANPATPRLNRLKHCNVKFVGRTVSERDASRRRCFARCGGRARRCRAGRCLGSFLAQASPSSAISVLGQEAARWELLRPHSLEPRAERRVGGAGLPRVP